MSDTSGITVITPKSIEEASSLSRTLAKSSLLSDAFRGKEADILMAVLTGAELGLAPMQSLRAIEVIKGKPTIKAEAMVALVRARKDVCVYLTLDHSDATRATWSTQRVGDPKPTVLSWTMEQSKVAGLTSSDMYRKYPDIMLRWRAASMLVKLVYSDVLLGLYDPEELRDEPPAPRDVTPVVDVVATAPKVRKHVIIDVSEPPPAIDLAAVIDAAPDAAALTALVGAIRARPEAERAALRPRYEARLKAVSP